MFPPMLMYLRVGKPGGRLMRMWLPLFLVWLILLPFVVLALAITIVADIVLAIAGQAYHHYTMLLLGLLFLVAELRDLTVTIDANDTNVDMRFV